MASERVVFQGLSARICWLGYGARAQFGLALNDLVARGEIRAHRDRRDHLDSGSWRAPIARRKPCATAAMRLPTGSLMPREHRERSDVGFRSPRRWRRDGIVAACGMVVVADGTPRSAERLRRVLTSDPGMGIARHAEPDTRGIARRSHAWPRSPDAGWVKCDGGRGSPGPQLR